MSITRKTLSGDSLLDLILYPSSLIAEPAPDLENSATIYRCLRSLTGFSIG